MKKKHKLILHANYDHNGDKKDIKGNSNSLISVQDLKEKNKIKLKIVLSKKIFNIVEDDIINFHHIFDYGNY